ncbi:MAG: peptide deformylase [Mariprofundaceae bacterium]|nr:peptide deformylase [Mariprofundaceae bacterium]
MRTILTQPDHRLREISKAVTEFDPGLELLLVELEALMRAGPGGVGIAAPQIGELQRVVIVDCRRSMRPCKNHGLLQMVNPKVIEGSGNVLGREGCLSVPDWVGMVPRAKEIQVCYQNPEGNSCKIESSGFEARVIQHEIDHLDGILFTDRVVSTRDLVRRLQSDT